MEATFTKLINEQEFVLLYDCHKSTNPEFPNWSYNRFDLEEKSSDDCKAEFCFYREDIYFTFHSDTVSCFDRLSVGWTQSVRHGTVGRFLNEKQAKLKSDVKDMPLMWYLNYLTKIPEVSRENFEN